MADKKAREAAIKKASRIVGSTRNPFLRRAADGSGDTQDIGPECFASADGSVICWKGENYVRQSDLQALKGRVEEALRACADAAGQWEVSSKLSKHEFHRLTKLITDAGDMARAALHSLSGEEE